MVKKHLKRLATPSTWKIPKKANKFTVRPFPSGYPSNMSIPVAIILRDVLKLANNMREVKNIIYNKIINVNGVRIIDVRQAIGLFDVLEIKDLNLFYRMVINTKGNLVPIKIDNAEADIKPFKIEGKTIIKSGKIQINFFGGYNIITDNKQYNVGDTLVLSIPKKEIKNHYKFGKNICVFLIGGSHMGEVGTIEDIRNDRIIFKVESGLFETSKEYAYIIGEEKPIISLEK